jgi:hypothetical protein
MYIRILLFFSLNLRIDFAHSRLFCIIKLITVRKFKLKDLYQVSTAQMINNNQ